MNQSKLWPRCALCVFAVLTFAATAARTQSPTTYAINLALAEQSQDNQGRTVLTMMASGDLQGVLTLAISTAADGSVTGGEWSLNVSYTAPLNPNATGEAGGEQLIQRGVLSGMVTAGSATLDNGKVTALIGVQLSVMEGTVEFASVPNGHGTVDSSNTNDRTNSTGSMMLTF